MNDPLADLLDEMGKAHEEYWDDQYLHYQMPFNEHEARWLRANRDRVLEALGGTTPPQIVVSTGTVLWEFPVREDQ